jgi:hypothetical protein
MDSSTLKVSKRNPFSDIEAAAKESSVSQMNTRGRGRRPAKLQGGENETNKLTVDSSMSKEEVEKLKVADLRELLLQQGVEKKLLRNMRKAELVTMVMDNVQANA